MSELEELRAMCLADPQEDMSAEVIVAHRIGFWNAEDLTKFDRDHIQLADDVLEKHIQNRIDAAFKDAGHVRP